MGHDRGGKDSAEDWLLIHRKRFDLVVPQQEEEGEDNQEGEEQVQQQQDGEEAAGMPLQTLQVGCCQYWILNGGNGIFLQ